MVHEDAVERQFSTFYIGDRMYGIEVQQVQEITSALNNTSVPLAPEFVSGVINLRGQISTAISLSKFFNISEKTSENSMHVVCMVDGNLISFIVDRVGDVMELKAEAFETAPDTVADQIKGFLSGVYKLPNDLLSILDIKKIWNHINS